MGHDPHPTSKTTASNPGTHSHGDVAQHALDADVLDRIAVILRKPKREVAELVAETGRDVAGRDERSTATDTGVDAVAAALARADIAHTVDRVGGGVVVVTVPLRGGARIVIQEGGNVGHPAGWLAERYATAQAAAGETLVDGAAELVPVVRAVVAEKVIDRYDEVVRSNTTDDYNAVRAVAYDDDGIWGVHGEVMDVAGEMGRFVDDDGTLSAATSRYQARLRAELELDGDVLDRITDILRKPDWSGADDLAALAELVAETGRDMAGPAGAEGVGA